eukprot:364791-Chlamydomonas_euryale.AAC.5
MGISGMYDPLLRARFREAHSKCMRCVAGTACVCAALGIRISALRGARNLPWASAQESSSGRLHKRATLGVCTRGLLWASAQEGSPGRLHKRATLGV